VDTAALIAWVITALGGSYLLATWLFRGGIRQRKTGTSTFPPLLILGHFLLAASGLVTWIAYLLTDMQSLAWAALIGLLLIATLGCTMFVRWGGETVQAAPAPILRTPATGEAVPRRYGAQSTGIAAAFGQGRGPAAVDGDGRGRGATPGMKSGAATAEEPTRAELPAESHFPIAVVAGHGAFAVCTLVLVLLATLGIGS
jgi:manganese efflux pump family protein